MMAEHFLTEMSIENFCQCLQVVDTNIQPISNKFLRLF